MSYSAGHILIMPKNNWNNVTTYKILDAVRHDGKAYLSKINGNTNHTPSGSTDNYWFLFAEDGFTPSVTASKTGKDTTITYTNRSGSSTSHVYDGDDGVDGVSVTGITKTGSQTVDGRVVDTYTVTYSNSTTSTFQVVNGKDGTGIGDMEKSVYDKDNNGIVDGVLGNTELIKDTVGFTSKNLIPYPYTTTTKTQNGVTITDNGDGSLKINGTSTAITYFNLDYVGSVGAPVINGSLKISLGTDDTHIVLVCQGLDSSGNIIPISGAQARGRNEVEFEYPSNVIYRRTYVQIDNNNTFNNVTVYPMLRKADIMDDTYEPYNPSVKQVLRNNKIIEGKNLIPYPWDNISSKEKNGITYTDNGDGTWTANGTSTAYAFFVYTNPFSYTQLKTMAGQKVILTGGFDSTKRVYLRYRQNASDSWTTLMDTGNGIEFTMPSDIYNYNRIEMVIEISTEQTVSNLVFKPMLRKATETDPTYEQYYIPGVVTQEAQNVLGAKNLFNKDAIPDVLYHATKTVTETGFQVKASDTTAWSSIKQDVILEPNTFYKITCNAGNVNLGSDRIKVVYINDNTETNVIEDYNKSSYELIFNTKNYTHFRISFFSCGATGIQDAQVNYTNIMLRLASDSDDTYTPYAMTNRELTEKVTRTEISNVDVNDITDAGIYYMMGSMTNTPGMNYGMLEVVNKHNYVRQIIYPEADGAAIYARLRASGTWQSWYKFTGTAVS